MRAPPSARAALLAAAMLLGATSAPAYDMETGVAPGVSGAIPRTRDPEMVRSVEVGIEPLSGSVRPAGPPVVSQGGRQAKPYVANSAKHAKKSGKKGKKGGKSGKESAKASGVRLGSVTDGADPVLAKP